MQIQMGKHKGNALIMGAYAFVGLIGAAFLLMVYLFVGSTLNTSLANPSVATIWGNIVTATTNFTTQLGTVGTIAGIMLLLAVIGGGAFLAYGAVKKGAGGSGM